MDVSASEERRKIAENTFAEAKENVISKPEVLFAPSEDAASTLLKSLKAIFEFGKSREDGQLTFGPLSELIVKEVDSDQIWEQIQLNNAPLLKKVKKFRKALQEKKLIPQLVNKTKKEKQKAQKKEEPETDTESSDRSQLSEDEDDVDSAILDKISDGDGDDGLEISQEALKQRKRRRSLGNAEDMDSDAVEKEDETENEEEEFLSGSEDILEEDPDRKSSKKKQKTKKDGDKFFDWDEMEQFAEDAEREELEEEDEEGKSKRKNRKRRRGDEDDEEEDESEDEGEEESDDEEDEDDDLGEDEDELGGGITYDDFFGAGQRGSGQRRRGRAEEDEEESDVNGGEEEEEEEEEEKGSELQAEQEEEDEDNEEELGIMSTFQKSSQRLSQQIKQLEEENVAARPWLLQGEVKSLQRPENSLLEATMDFDRTTRPAPLVTIETTAQVEDIIKKRILEQQWDDVIRKLAPQEKAQRELADVSQEKSKLGLGEIYEKEYMKSVMGVEETDEKKKEQDEILEIFRQLCRKLDALSSFHYTPKPTVVDMSIKPNVSSIAMEEVLPVAVSDGQALAPEEVYDKKRGKEGVLRGDEIDQDDRKKIRRAKKSAKRKAKKQREADERLVARINPGLGNKHSKQKILESLKAKNVTKGKEMTGSSKQFTKSSEFFSRLQDTVNTTAPSHKGKK